MKLIVSTNIVALSLVAALLGLCGPVAPTFAADSALEENELSAVPIEPEPAPELPPSAKQETPVEPEVVPTAPLPAAPAQDSETVLESPTRSVEEYERVRQQRLHISSLPRYGINLTVEPRSFGKLDLRQPAKRGFDQSNPRLFGVLVGYDHTLFNRGGILMVGLDAGFYSSTASEPYKGLTFGFPAVEPHVRWEALFLQKQWVVPVVKVGYELLRYNYSFQNQSIRGFKGLPRLDLGLMLYLNILEPSSAGNMEGNYGIKRTYLTAYYSVANDAGKRDFNMTDQAFRVGLNFEH